MNAINTGWFKDRIAMKQMSQRKLAKALGLDPAAMSLMLRGRRTITPQEAEKMAAELGVPLTTVLEQIGLDVTAGASAKATIRGRTDDAGRVVMGRVEGPRRVEAPIGMADDAAAIRATRENFTDGWLYFYQPTDTITMDAVGRLCVAQVAGKDEWHLRVVRRGYSKGTWTLADPLGSHVPIENVRLSTAAPVLWIRTSA